MLHFMSPYFNNYYNIQGIIRHFFIFLNYDNNVIINERNNLIHHYILILFPRCYLFRDLLTFKAGTSLLKT